MILKKMYELVKVDWLPYISKPGAVGSLFIIMKLYRVVSQGKRNK